MACQNRFFLVTVTWLSSFADFEHNEQGLSSPKTRVSPCAQGRNRK